MCKRENEIMDYRDFYIETEDLILKKAVHEDWKDMYYNLWKHEESAKYMLWEVTKSEEKAIERIEKSIEFMKKNKYALFINEKKTDKAIGFVGMKEIEPGAYEDTGVALGPEFVGKGYGTKVLNALVDEAKKAGAHKFVWSCREKNIASHKLQMSCGFVFSHDEDRVDPRDNTPYVLEFNEKQLS